MKSLRKFQFALDLCLAATVATAVAHAVPTQKNLDDAFARGQWDETAQMAHEILQRDPDNSLAKLREGYALFQRGYTNAALLALKRLSPEEWKRLPQGQDRLVEILTFFQKKLPLELLPGRLDQVSVEATSPAFRDEVRFAKGREAFERGDAATARNFLNQIGKGSRYFSEARYLLGTLASQERNYPLAEMEFSRLFEPTVFQQSQEFWQDVSAQVTEHWGATLKVMMDPEILRKSNTVAQLGQVALARTAYAARDFERALARYDQMSPESPQYPRSRLERVWTMLALNRHEDAAAAAASISGNGEARFESVEARILRALILADASKTVEARAEIDQFLKLHEKYRSALERFKSFHSADILPGFAQNDLKDDARLALLAQYDQKLNAEIKAMRSEDQQIFPVYAYLTSDMEPLATQGRNLATNITNDHINRRLADLERLYVQAKLIVAETYLEDREKLRVEYQQGDKDEARQNEHDRKLVTLLSNAVDQVDEAMKRAKQRHFNLELRQSELLWELSSARTILSQSSKSDNDREMGEKLKKKSLAMAVGIAESGHGFSKHPQALFFIGYAQLDMGHDAEGLKNLLVYVKQYPQHMHVPDAYRILADYDFDRNRFSSAESYYQKILEFRSSSVVGYALYKIGWCAYNRREFGKALLGLEQAIVWADRNVAALNLLSLSREARRDLIAIYAEFGDHRKAVEYFRRFLRGDVDGWVLELAKQLDTTGQHDKSTDLYTQLIALNPTSQDNLHHQIAIVKGFYKLHRPEMMTEAAAYLVERYRAVLQEPKPEGDPAALAEQALREAVMGQHFEFSKADVKDAIDRVLKLDDIYLSTFGAWPVSQEILYQHSHFLLNKNRIPESVTAFRSHWEKFNLTLKEPLREEALRNLIHSLELAEETNKAPTKGSADKVSDYATEILTYSDIYGKTYATTKHARPIAFLRSGILFKYHQNTRAILETQAIFDADPADNFGMRAFKNLRIAFYDSKDWQKTHEWAASLQSRKAPGMEKHAKDLKTIREETLFLWADTAKDSLAAADLYMRVARDPEMGRLREKSLYNAFVHFHKANLRIEALKTAKQLEQMAPSYNGLSQLAGIRSALYQDAGDYGSALPLLERFLKEPDKEAAKTAIVQARLNAGLIAEGVAKYDVAADHFKKYLNEKDGTTEGGLAEAKRGLERIAAREKRVVAAIPKELATLAKNKADFEKRPLPKGNDIADRIRQGAAQLETLSRKFLEVASDPKVSPAVAYEAYCALPFLYNAYSNGLFDIGKGLPEDAKVELAKLGQPIVAKVGEISQECIQKSWEGEHEGTFYREVLYRWGWRADVGLRTKVDALVAKLGPMSPWLDPATVTANQNDIITQHIEGKGTPETWYTLARMRWDQRQRGLFRLTVIDALAKTPDSPRLLNALAVFRESEGTQFSPAPLYKDAAAKGSPLAWANLGYYHLKASRLEPAKEPFAKALAAGVFDTQPELKAAIQGVIRP